LSVEVLRVL